MFTEAPAAPVLEDRATEALQGGVVRTVVLTAAGLFFTGMGLYALAAPARLVRPFGIAVGTTPGRSEVRAVYGGFGLAVVSRLPPHCSGRRRRPATWGGAWYSRSRSHWPGWRRAG
ncbi:DUF4345 family protein [Nocardia flavorosea]|uniref:DUF4345 family protein n=1 Tax=Nocardia flavorosea TaxID=53429 RepID=UPI00313A7F72